MYNRCVYTTALLVLSQNITGTFIEEIIGWNKAEKSLFHYSNPQNAINCTITGYKGYCIFHTWLPQWSNG